jgi:dolichyl-phosphate beta-glucosyltransferase
VADSETSNPLPFLTIVIPAYNEKDRIQSSLNRVLEYFNRRAIPFELIVVDDGSEDNTAQIADSTENPGAHCVRLKVLRNNGNRGKGYSVRRGMLAALGQYGLFSDTDLSTPIEEYAKLEVEVVNGAHQIAIGSRDVEGSKVEIHQSWIRENGGKLFNRLVRMLVRLPFHDTQCGFKLFDMRHKEALFGRQRIEGFGFDVELLTIANKLGLSAKEVPVVWRHASGSKIRFLRDGTRMMGELLQIRWNEISGQYDPD